MLYALAVICATNGPCIAHKDTRGPYRTRAACEARMAEMRPFVRATAAQLAGAVGTVDVAEICATLPEIRSIWPDAYPDARHEVPV